MQTRSWKIWIGLGVLIALGFAGYLGWHVWGSSDSRGAQVAIERRDFRLARGLLERHLRAAPDDGQAHLAAAQTAWRVGDLSVAEQHVRMAEAAGASADAIGTERHRIDMYRGEVAEADKLLTWCRAHPENTETPLNLEAIIEGSLRAIAVGTELGHAADGPEVGPHVVRAREAVELWMRIRPAPVDQAQALVWRGAVAMLINDQAAGKAHLREAVERAPDLFDARLQRALAVASDDPQEAAGHLRILIQRYPHETEVRFNLAVVLRTLGELDEAAQLLDGLLEAEPKNVKMLTERGYLYLNTPQADEAGRRRQAEAAERVLRRALELAPNSPEVNLALSGCLTRLGKLDEARAFDERSQALAHERDARKQGGSEKSPKK